MMIINEQVDGPVKNLMDLGQSIVALTYWKHGEGSSSLHRAMRYSYLLHTKIIWEFMPWYLIENFFTSKSDDSLNVKKWSKVW